MAMELKIISPTEDGYIKSIEFNFDELKAELETRLEKYEGLAYTDETIQDAKKDRATLNNFTKALSAKRIEIKKRCLAPYDAFEAKIKELTAMVDEPVKAIDKQVKGYEERKRTEKAKAIQAYWDAQESNVKTLVSLDRIFNPKWNNVGYALTKIEDEITAFFEKVELELDTIEELGPEFKDQVTDVYLRDFNLANALAEDKRLKEQKAKQEEYRRQQEEAKKKREQEEAEAKAAAAQEAAQAPQEQPAEEPAPEPQPEPVKARTHAVAHKPVTLTIDFRVEGTGEQFAGLRRYLEENGIKYSRIENQQAA